MKTYVTHWWCAKCMVRLEFRTGTGFTELTETGPRCSECATQLQFFDALSAANPWSVNAFLRTVIVDFQGHRR